MNVCLICAGADSNGQSFVPINRTSMFILSESDTHKSEKTATFLLFPTVKFLQLFNFLDNNSLSEQEALPTILNRVLVILQDSFTAIG